MFLVESVIYGELTKTLAYLMFEKIGYWPFVEKVQTEWTVLPISSPDLSLILIFCCAAFEKHCLVQIYPQPNNYVEYWISFNTAKIEITVLQPRSSSRNPLNDIWTRSSYYRLAGCCEWCIWFGRNEKSEVWKRYCPSPIWIPVANRKHSSRVIIRPSRSET